MSPPKLVSPSLMDTKAAQLAEAIRAQLDEKVNTPGLRAIKAVLMLNADGTLVQADVVNSCGTSKGSIRKYRALLSRLAAAGTAPADSSSSITIATTTTNSTESISSTAAVASIAATNTTTATTAATNTTAATTTACTIACSTEAAVNTAAGSSTASCTATSTQVAVAAASAAADSLAPVTSVTHLRALLTPSWLEANLPSISNLRVASLCTIDGKLTRVLRADVAAEGTVQTLEARARYRPKPAQAERPAERRERQGVNWHAEVRAVRALDVEAKARADQLQRERMAAQRLADAALQLAPQLPAGHRAWMLPAETRPRFQGECVCRKNG